MQRELRLHRGIAAPRKSAEEVRGNILRTGIQGDEGTRWRFEMNDLKDKLESLFNKPDLTIKDTRPLIGWFPVVCACGDKLGATYYEGAK